MCWSLKVTPADAFSMNLFLTYKKRSRMVDRHFHTRSSLFYNKSARPKRHERDTSDKSATPLRHYCAWVRNERHQYDMSASRTTRLRHDLKNLILIMTWVKAFFHTLILAIWQIKDYIKRKDFIRRTTLPRFPAKMPLESVPQKLNFVIAKVISKSCRL